MKLELTTPPASEFITVAEAATQVFGDATFDSGKLTRDIAACRKAAEEYCERAFINQQWQMTLDKFPSETTANPRQIIYLPKGKCQSIVSDQISYIDEDGTTQTLDKDTDFILDTTGDTGRLLPTEALGGWPDVSDYHLNCVTVNFVAGYGASLTSEQDPIKDAVLYHIGTLYELRQTITVQEIFENEYWKFYLHPYKIYFDFRVNDE